ncbi:MAG: DUF4402 domain-containing protein [Alphaproteobacteria bacterium]|nr:DUF4402 domain-containing protein [Alphaproteobacteria bacterium]
MSCRKRLNLAGTFVVALLIGAELTDSPAWAAGSAPVQVSANLRPVISVTAFQNINFGDLIVGQAPTGLFEIRPDGSVVFTGSGLTPTTVITPQAGQVDIVGQIGQAIDVSCESAVVANVIDEAFQIGISVAELAQAQSVSCAGLGTPVLTVPQTQSVSSVFVGGAINAADLAGITSFDMFSSNNAAGVAAVFQAVYQ